MKRLTAFAAICILLGTLIFPVSAAEGPLTMTDLQANPGDTIRITVSLQEQLQGNALGIAYTYDETQLEALPDQCAWSRKGVLQDFGGNQDGVWAVNDPVDLNGEVCVLAFRVLENAAFTKAEVACTLIVKNGTQEVGTYQASAAVSRACTHTFGQWQDSGEIGHSRVCSLCSSRQTQSHQWEEGPVTQDPDNANQGIRTNTCTICGGTRTERAGSYVPERLPTEPTVDRREEEVTRPTQPHNQPTYPTDEEEPVRETEPKPTDSPRSEATSPTQSTDRQEPEDQQGGYTPGDYNLPPEETKDQSSGTPEQEHIHVRPDGETIPQAIPIEGWTGDAEEPATSADLHDHDHETAENKGGAAAFVVTSAVLAVAGVLVYRKTKRR